MTKVSSMEIKNKKIIITGGSGFLGRHLVSKLIELGIPKNNIFVPMSKDYDLRNSVDIERMFKNFKADIVIHLATHSGGVQYYKTKPATIFYDNLIMGIQLLEISRKYDVKKFVFIGTGLIYPKDATIPLKESSIWHGYPEETAACYGLASRAHLAQSQFYRKEHGFNSIYIILPNLYGPGDHFNTDRAHVIPSLIMRFNEAIKNKKEGIEFWGSGKAYREFLYVEDAVLAIIEATKSYNQHDPINIGPGSYIQIKFLAETIGKIMGYKGLIKRDESKPEGQLKRCFDTSQMQLKLNFRPSVKIEEGLKKTIKWFKENE